MTSPNGSKRRDITFKRAGLQRVLVCRLPRFRVGVEEGRRGGCR